MVPSLVRLLYYCNHISEGTILVTLDVDASYTNTPMHLGIDRIVEYYGNSFHCWKDCWTDIKPISQDY